MDGKEIISKVNELGLPSKKYTVVGSGSLAARGIREAADIDLLITPDLYKQLKESGWQEKHFQDSKRGWVLYRNSFDASTSWSVNDYDPKPDELIANSDVIGGINFVNLSHLLTWKKACRREKDLRDIKLIENYLNTHKARNT